MGGEHQKRRHPGLLYPACMMLIASVISAGVAPGCMMPELHRTRPPSDDIRLKRHMAAYEEQIQKNAFQEAAKTNKNLLKILNAREPENTDSNALLIKQSHAAQTLLDQIMVCRSQERRLAEQILKNERQLGLKDQSAASLKILIKSLNQTIQELEEQTSQLEKQIKRMKQIDLK